MIDFCGLVVAGITSTQNILHFWWCRWCGISWPTPCSAGSCLTTAAPQSCLSLGAFGVYSRLFLSYLGRIDFTKARTQEYSCCLLEHLTTGLALGGYRTELFQWEKPPPMHWSGLMWNHGRSYVFTREQESFWWPKGPVTVCVRQEVVERNFPISLFIIYV